MNSNKSDIHIAVIDQTQYWDEEFVKITGRMFGVYVFDKNRHVHCCEITPSYELHFVEDIWENRCEVADRDECEADSIDQEILMTDNEPVSYYHTYVIDGGKDWPACELPEGSVGLRRIEGPWPDDSDEAIEEALEYARCNGLV